MVSVLYRKETMEMPRQGSGTGCPEGWVSRGPGVQGAGRVWDFNQRFVFDTEKNFEN